MEQLEFSELSDIERGKYDNIITDLEERIRDLENEIQDQKEEFLKHEEKYEDQIKQLTDALDDIFYKAKEALK